ncbi:MAG: endonuclease/exonuclease/phosphatase family protein [Myxococcota bacterium]
MHLVSWNLNGLEDENLDVRTEAALTEILLGGDMMALLASGRPPDLPDVVVLQEVVERTYVAHVVPHLRAAGFALVPPEPPARGYFEVAAVRGTAIRLARWVPFPRTGQGRALLELQLANGLTVMTAHLESLKPGGPVRMEQAQFVLERLRRAGPAVFAGDTNLRNAEWDSLDSEGVEDAWRATGAVKADRDTWGRARYDRVWGAGGVRFTGFRRLGTDDVPEIGEPPSDHVGLRVSFEVAESLPMPSEG